MNISKLRSTSLFFGALCLAFSTLTAGVLIANQDSTHEVQAYYSPSTTYEVTTPSTYYASISDSLTGSSLLDSLQSLNASKRKKTIGYDAMGTSASSSPYVYTDYDPNGTVLTDSKGQQYGTSLASFYTKTPMTEYNKEHVWPNSRGGSYVEADIHMPRPTISAENSNRGNSFYVEGVASSSSGWDPYTAGYSETVRGEAARIIFYCMVASSSLSLSDATNISSGAPGYTTTMGKISDMLKWNLEYSVSTYENNRNNGAQYLQGNRNPFIDHPEYACKIWGDFNTTTASICSSYATAPNTITVTPSSSSIAVGATTTLTASVDTGSSNVTWSTSNSSVATVSNGVVTGVAAGSATITATSTVDTSVKGTATVTVKSISSLSVSGTPSITSYTAGQSFNASGLTVTATYSDSSTANVTSNVTWSPDPLTAGTTSVTGSYANKSISVSGLTVTANYTATINKTNSTILSTTALTSDTAQEYTITDGTDNAGTMSILWSAGSYAPSSYDEVTIPASTGKISSNDSTYVKTMTLDLYKYDNISVYADGVEVTGVAGTATSNNSSLVYIFTINSSNWYIQNVTTSYTQNIYSMELEVEIGVSSVAVTGVSLNHSSLSLTAGSNSTLTATVSPSNATNKNVTWSTNNPSVATVNSGNVTAIATGNATITVITSDGSHTATCAVTVSNSTLSSISVSGQTTSFNVGDEFVFGGTCTATYSDNSTAVVTPTFYSGYDMNTAGSYTVLVSYTQSSITKTTSYSIIVSPVASGLSIDKTVASTSVGGTVTITATAGGTVTWSTSNSSIASVSGGVVTGVAIGTATITATYGSYSKTCEITVTGTISGGSESGSSYTKVTSQPTSWDGTYLIVYESSMTEGYIFNGSLTTLDAVNNYQSVSISDNTISYDSGTTGTYEFTIATSGSGYSIQSQSGYYIGGTSNTNGLLSSTSTTYVNSISYDSSSSSIFMVHGGGAYLRFNSASDQLRFRYYKSGTYTAQKPIELYKLETSSAELTTAQKAEQYAVDFNAANVCGTNDNTLAVSSIWLEQQTAFTALDSATQAYLAGADVTDTSAYSTAVIACITRYDRVVDLYYNNNPALFPNFMSRTISNLNPTLLSSKNDSALFTIILSLIGVLTLGAGGYLVLKKKKYH